MSKDFWKSPGKQAGLAVVFIILAVVMLTNAVEWGGWATGVGIASVVLAVVFLSFSIKLKLDINKRNVDIGTYRPVR